MPCDDFKDDEYIYRGIPNSQSHIRTDVTPNIITSANFKDKRGVSVDRGCGRTEQEVIQKMLEDSSNRGKPYIAILKIKYSVIRSLNLHLIHVPVEQNGNINENPFHYELHESENIILISSNNANILKESAIRVDLF